MKLFTSTDLERAARLAATSAAKGASVELAVGDAVGIVMEETPQYFDEVIVRKMLSYVAQNEREPSELLEEALAYVHR